MTNENQQNSQQPQTQPVRETEHAFAPSPFAPQPQEEPKTTPEVPGTTAPEKDIDTVN